MQTGDTLGLEALFHFLLAVEDPSQADGAQGLVDHRSQGPFALALRARPLLDLRAIPEEGVGQDGRRASDHQGQSPVEPEKHGTHANEEEDTGQDLDQGVR